VAPSLTIAQAMLADSGAGWANPRARAAWLIAGEAVAHPILNSSHFRETSIVWPARRPKPALFEGGFMSNGISFPFVAKYQSDGPVFEIAQLDPNTNPGTPNASGEGGVAIQAYSYGVAIDGTAAVGVRAHTDVGFGVWGESEQGNGVYGWSLQGGGEGVIGQGKNGVHGISASPTDSGVWGENTGGGYGVSGSTTSDFLLDAMKGTSGVWGHNYGGGWGVKGTSAAGDGVFGYSWSNVFAGVSAFNESGGVGLFAKGTPAGRFEGNVEVNGNLIIGSTGDVIFSDCAEHFDLADVETEGGTVMVIAEDGKLRPSTRAYDKTVAGVVSGAGNLRPGIVLGRSPSSQKGMPIALVGKAYCKVDARETAIEVGDLLTTSVTPGHAMKAEDPKKAFGAVIGKALGSLKTGVGLIPILIALQ
jgi:hypothetical protein